MSIQKEPGLLESVGLRPTVWLANGMLKATAIVTVKLIAVSMGVLGRRKHDELVTRRARRIGGGRGGRHGSSDA